MDKFDKNIKHNLENREEPVFQNSSWQRMQQKMAEDAIAPKSPKRAFPWLPLLLITCLAGSLGVNYWMYQKNNSILTFLNSMDTQAPNILTDTLIQVQRLSDTVFVYVESKSSADKISIAENTVNLIPKNYLSSVLTSNPAFVNKFNKKFQQNPSLAFTLFDSPKTNNQNQLANNSLSNRFQKTNSQNLNSTVLNANTNVLSKSQSKHTIAAIQSSKLAQFEYPKTLLSDVPILPMSAAAKKRKSLQQVLYPMRPKQFSLALTAGSVLFSQDNLEELGGYSINFQPTLSFSKNFNLFAHFSFIKLSYETQEINERLGVPFVDPPFPNYEFEYANVEQNSYQFGLGAQYIFHNSTRFKPYLGVSMASMRLLPYELEYEFENDNMEISQTTLVDQNKIINNLLLMQAGLDFEVSKSWSLRLEGYWRNNLNQDGIASPNILGFNSGIIKKF